MNITPGQATQFINAYGGSIAQGTIATVNWWPNIRIAFGLPLSAPLITGSTETVTITDREDAPPDVTAANPRGEISLTPDEVAAMSTWPTFWSELRTKLETKFVASLPPPP